MARLPRIVLPNQPLHIMHRGNNRQDIFEDEEDMLRIKEDIEISLSKSKCSLHAYVIMTNHFHLLLSPKNKEELRRFMQSVANRYVRYYNAKHHRTGTIWEGRYKSCLVDSDNYLFMLYQYIELNPVRACMVRKPHRYPWSSYKHHALGQEDKLIIEHVLYQKLGADAQTRGEAYQELFDEIDIKGQADEIAEATERGEVYGSSTFHQKVGKLLTWLGPHGGDRKSEKYQNQAG